MAESLEALPRPELHQVEVQHAGVTVVPHMTPGKAW
jgi:hypothetical protein